MHFVLRPHLSIISIYVYMYMYMRMYMYGIELMYRCTHENFTLECTTYRIWQIFQGGKLSRFSCFFTQLRMFSIESFTRLDISLLKEAATTKVFQLMFIFRSNRKKFSPSKDLLYTVLC